MNTTRTASASAFVIAALTERLVIALTPITTATDRLLRITPLADRAGPRIEGGLGHSTLPAEAVRERLLRALPHGVSLLILHLSRVSFCDAAGLGALAGVHQARTLDMALGLATPRPHVVKVLRLTGLDRGFPMYCTTPGRGTGVGTGRVRSGPAAAR